MQRFAPLLMVMVLAGCGSSKVETPPAVEPEATGAAPAVSRETAEAVTSSVSPTSPTPARPATDVTAPLTQLRPPKPGAIVKTPVELKKEEWQLADTYKGKVLQATGVIANLGQADDGRTSVQLKTGDGFIDFISLQLKEKQSWAALSPGQTVVLQGEATTGEWAAFEWDVIQVGPNPTPVLTAKDLAKEFAKNFSASESRYRDQRIYVDGTLEEVFKDENDTIYFRVGSDEGITIQFIIDFEYTFKGIETRLKPGVRLAGLGLVKYIDEEARQITLEAMPIEGAFPVKGVTYASELPTLAQRIQQLAESVKAKAPELTITSQQALNELNTNRSSYAERYSNKWVDISGVIKRFSANSSGSACAIELQTDDDNHNVSVQVAEWTPWVDYSPGQKVTIRAKASEFLLVDPTFENGVVIQADPLTKKRPSFSALELTALAAADPEKFEQEWEGQVIELKGELLEHPASEYDSSKLSPSNGFEIFFRTSNQKLSSRIGTESQVVGSPTRLFGKVSFFGDDNVIQLDEAWLLPVSKP